MITVVLDSILDAAIRRVSCICVSEFLFQDLD